MTPNPAANDFPYNLVLLVVLAIGFFWLIGWQPAPRDKKRWSDNVARLLQQLDPLIVVLSLFVCEFAYGRRLTTSWAALVLVVFVISTQLFGQREARDSSCAFSSFSQTYLRKALQWLFVVATLLLCAYAFNVSSQLPRRVFLTWFVITPILLTITHVLRGRTHALVRSGSTSTFAISSESGIHSGAVLKRAMDLVLGGLIMALTLPLMATIAMAVRLNSRGPALFRQRRYGMKGEEIILYKFRCSLDPRAKPQDTRITLVGRFIRETSLDGLPQIFNVLEGKMSFVGPRPLTAADYELYRVLISGQSDRYTMRPGITGWAQVNGLRGDPKTLDKISDRVRYDLEYVRRWSLWLDIKILAMTLAGGVRGHKNSH